MKAGSCFMELSANCSRMMPAQKAGVCVNVKLNDVLADIYGLAKHLLSRIRKRPAWSMAGAQLRAKPSAGILRCLKDSFPPSQAPKNIMRIFFFFFCL